MKILVLGGTAFVGRTFVEIAVSRGHEVTLFNRGRRNPDLFPELETILGDRAVDLSPLDGREWGAVFDTSGYLPRVVGASCAALRGRVGRYLFISSVSVLKQFGAPGQSEDTELATLDDPAVEEVTGDTYGGLKVLCEQQVTQASGPRALIVRPGLIVGPHDPTGRFTYWPLRMSRGGEVLAPDVKSQPVQVIDVRDLSAWCLDLLERGQAGIYNATGPQQPYSFEQVMQACAEGTDVRLIWVDTGFLKQHEVEPWSDLPLALPYDGSWNGMSQIDVSRALAAGLKLRPLAETIRDTREWAISLPAAQPPAAGLSSEREAELLAAWAAS